MKRPHHDRDASHAPDLEDAPTEPYGKADEPDPHFLSPDTAAGILRVNRKTVYAAIAAGTIKVLRLGRILRIPTSAILDLAGLASKIERRPKRR